MMRKARPSERMCEHGVREIPEWYAHAEAKREHLPQYLAAMRKLPREMPHYDGHGASTALELVVERKGEALQAASDRADFRRAAYARDDGKHFADMLAEQIKREPPRKCPLDWACYEPAGHEGTCSRD